MKRGASVLVQSANEVFLDVWQLPVAEPGQGSTDNARRPAIHIAITLT